LIDKVIRNKTKVEFSESDSDLLNKTLAIIELKCIKKTKGFTIENIKSKFTTCLDDFISTQFKDILNIEYKTLKLFFISNIEIYKRDIGLKMEALMDVRFEYRNRKYMIIPYKPSPVIKKCY